MSCSAARGDNGAVSEGEGLAVLAAGQGRALWREWICARGEALWRACARAMGERAAGEAAVCAALKSHLPQGSCA